MEWETERLGDLGQVVTGRTPPKAKPEMFGLDFPFLTPSDMGFMERTVQTERYLSHDGASRFERILLPAGSACFVCIGATIGKASITNETTFSNQQINSIIPDPTKADGAFIYYSVASNPDLLKKQAGGAATPIINKSAFSNIEIPLPPLPIQRRIAGILSAYDDLIEVNTRRIKALEKMARLAYASLHSDEYEMFSSNSLVTKKISGDWGKEQPTDTHSMPVSIIRGTDFKNLEVGNYSTVPTRWVRPIDLERKQLMPMDLVVENSVNAKSRHCGTPLLINNHMLNALGGKVVCASFCRGFRFGKKVHATSMKYWFQEIRENGEISQYQNIAANGIANFQSTIFMEKAKCKIIIDEHPAANLMNDANTGVYRAQLSNLRAQRDLLLPRLVSGAIDVSDAESAMPKADVVAAE